MNRRTGVPALHEALATEMGARGMTQADLVRMFGTSDANVSRWLNPRDPVRPGYRWRRLLCTFLNCDDAYLSVMLAATEEHQVRMRAKRSK